MGKNDQQAGCIHSWRAYHGISNENESQQLVNINKKNTAYGVGHQ